MFTRHVRRPRRTNAVFTGDGASDVKCQFVDRVGEFHDPANVIRIAPIDQHRRMQASSPDMPVRRDGDIVAITQVLNRSENSRDPVNRHTDVFTGIGARTPRAQGTNGRPNDRTRLP